MTRSRAESSGEAATTVATLVAVAMIAAQVAGKATRDAYFLSIFPATALPGAMAGAAGLSLLSVLAISTAMTRWSPARVVPVAFLLHAVLFVAEWALSASFPAVTAVLVYLHTSSLGGTVISAFWSAINERFDPHAAKRAVKRVAAGAALGGVVGGIAAWQLSRSTSLPVLLLWLAGINLLCAIAATRLGGRPTLDRAADTTEPAPSAARILREVPYLRQLAVLVVLGAIGESAIDYVLKASAADHYTEDATLVTFFATFHMCAAVAAFALQTTLVGRSLRSLGLTGTVALLPGVVVSFGVVGLLSPALWSAIAVRGGALTVESSFYRSGYELLYTPLTPEKKRPTKTLIDVGCQRIGLAFGAGLVMLVLWIFPSDHSLLALLGVAVTTGLASLALTRTLDDGYVTALADSLRAGLVALRSSDVIDRTTQRTLTETNLALDRRQLLREIAALREADGAATSAASTTPAIATADPTTSVDPATCADPALLAAVADLHSRDLARVRARLRAPRPWDPVLVGHLIPLLGRDALVRDVVAALRPLAVRASGQLVDALLDPATPTAVRRRLPRVLRAAGTQRAADGLLAGLADPAFEVRDWCGVALDSMRTRDPTLSFPAEPIFEAARREAAGCPVASDDAVVHIEHIFRVLSLVLESEPLRLAHRALQLADPALRGTAFEYLENTLPEAVQRVLLPHLGQVSSKPRQPRPRGELVDQLLASAANLGLHRPR